MSEGEINATGGDLKTDGLHFRGSEDKSVSDKSLNLQSPGAESVDSSILAAFRLHDDDGERDDERDEFPAECSDLYVVVGNPEKHQGTMEAYVTFRVTTKTTRSEFDSHEYCVRRRYSEFLWLRYKLEESHPSHIIPPLPGKQTMKRLEHFTIEFVRVRMFHLNQFLNRVAEHPVLSSDKSYQIFLTAKASEFASHKKTGYGFIHKVGDSLHGIAAGVMMKERPQEFVTVADYVATFTEKLGNVDRIAQRIQREQRDYAVLLHSYSPIWTLWSSCERTLAVPLETVAEAVDRNFRAMHKLNSGYDMKVMQPLREYALYADAVRAALRRRDAMQIEYELTTEELKRRRQELEQVQTSDQSYSLGAWMGKDPTEIKKDKEEKLEALIKSLVRQVDEACDVSVCANADLKSDWERWHTNKRGDFRRAFTAAAKRNVDYYETSLAAWEDALQALQRCDPDADPDDLEVEAPVDRDRSPTPE